MDVERVLITKIITTGLLEDAISKGLRDDLFYDDECREMWDYLREHMMKYKSPPSLAAVKADMPNFELEHVQDSLEYLIDRFIRVAKRRLANEMVVELAQACDDPERSDNIDQEFLEVSRKLATLIPSTEVSRYSDADKRIKEYEKKKKEGDKFGVTLGMPTLDLWTGGLQPHEFATVAGFSGLGKSTFLGNTSFNVHAQGKTPMYISLEMEAGTLLRKFDAMAKKLDYHKMKQLDLSDEQMDDWRKHAEEVKNSVADIPVIDSIRNCTPDHIFAEAVRHSPDLIVVDYISLMRSSRSSRGASQWQSITEITQDLKQIARTLKIPILAAAQTNRSGGKEGAELDNIGSSISIVQDSDIVIGLFADDEMKQAKEMEVRLRKNRDGRLGEFRCVWDHENLDFREKTHEDKWGRSGPSAVERIQSANFTKQPDKTNGRKRPQRG